MIYSNTRDFAVYQSSDGAHVFDIQIDVSEAPQHDAELERSILFPDKDLLFTANFKRAGADLVLVGSEMSALILGYFKGERRLGITTSEGAGLKGATIEALVGPDISLRYAQTSDAVIGQTPIGRVEKVSGSVTVLRNGILIEIRLGDTVARGDVVQTGPDSSLTVKFNDGTVFNLSSSARMVINDMVYAADSSGNTAFFTLIQGLIGFVAGHVAKTGDFKVETPVATMAIRGTAVQTEIIAISGTTRFSLLAEPDGKVGSILILDKNNTSRVLASMSDSHVATLLIPVAGADPQVTQIAKTNDEIRGESDFVRDLFQFVSSEPRQRRGSSDSEDAPIIPANLIQPIKTSETLRFVLVPVHQENLEPREQIFTEPISVLAPIRGTAIEDGPVARLGAVSTFTEADPEGPPRVFLPEKLPPGVRYLDDTRNFTLDPTHPAYQNLGKHEFKTVTVKYELVLNDGTVIPASITWTVTGRNDAPIAKDDRIAALDEVGQTVLALIPNDRDIDGDTLRVVSWTSPFEGSIHLDAQGKIVFNPKDDFSALSKGETATVSFDYTVSDGNGGRDTAKVTLQIQGKGVFSSPKQTASDTDTLAFNDQQVALTMIAPDATTKEKADLQLSVSLGKILEPQINILYLIDVSGSTAERFVGEAVGDLNGDGRGNTVLDAEIASLLLLTDKVKALGFSPADVTVTVIPFNESADPTNARDPDLSGLSAASFTFDSAGSGAIENYLKNLDAGGETNFSHALQAANEHLQSLDQGNEINVLYFLSDGRGQGPLDVEIALLNDRYNTTISALGVGEDASLSQLKRIDNTDGASLLTAPDQIDVSIVGQPLQTGKISDVDVFVNGMEIVEIGPEDFIVIGNRLVLNTSVEGLQQLSGDRNAVSASITFESGEVLTAALSIEGALPRSTDLVV
jgi:VCBS repeat-containing protein